jgi:tRNA-(ms[2]io[6]A)-hydroxylase
VLELRYETPATWAKQALAEPLALLSDHAHCELRAASSAQGLITRNPSIGGLVDSLSRLALEEMRHFRQVIALLSDHGGELLWAQPNPYVENLINSTKASRGAVLLDRLLVAGLVELRSLERFDLLASEAKDTRIRALYAELGPSEAGHATLFSRLAEELFALDKVRSRVDQMCDLEAEVVSKLTFAPRMHSGVYCA